RLIATQPTGVPGDGMGGAVPLPAQPRRVPGPYLSPRVPNWLK
ncbi:hypothetical protein HaLaN_33045, partial [Haematococcus lacustris]